MDIIFIVLWILFFALIVCAAASDTGPISHDLKHEDHRRPERRWFE